MESTKLLCFGVFIFFRRMKHSLKLCTYAVTTVAVMLLFHIIGQREPILTQEQTHSVPIRPKGAGYNPCFDSFRGENASLSLKSTTNTQPARPAATDTQRADSKGSTSKETNAALTRNTTTILKCTQLPLTRPDKDRSLRESATLTRWGKELRFDEKLCPPKSSHAMVNFTNVTQLHDDCPAVFIVGARKGGTTSLYQYISKHPEFTGVRLDRGPRAGETFYFEHHNTSSFHWPEYKRIFSNVKNGTISGDSSVGNLVACHVPQLMLQVCGTKPRIIMLLRNPVDRYASNYLMQVRLSRAYNFSNQTMQHLGRYVYHVKKSGMNVNNLQCEWSKLRCLFGAARNFIFEGVYYVHLLNWLCNFPQENIMVVNSEELFRNTTRVLAQVFNFIGLSPLSESTLESITNHVYNNGNYSVPARLQLSLKQRTRLTNLYKPYNKALFELLDWTTLEWS